MTDERRAGDAPQASDALLPAATTKVTPASTAACTASSRAWLGGATRLRFATAGRRSDFVFTLERWDATQFTPAMTVDRLA
jgi:hypothetical protein